MTERPHFYYKFAVDGTVGVKLQEFMDQCADAEEKARQWVDKQGASGYYESPDGMAGGVAAVEFENAIAKEGWERSTTPKGESFFLPEADSGLEKEMYALPVVSETQLIGILALKPRKNRKGQSLPFTFGNVTPVIFKHHEYWYVDVPYESADASSMRIEEKEYYRRRMAAINERK